MLKVKTIGDVTHMLSAPDFFDATRRIVDERHYLRTSYPEAMDMFDFDPFPAAEGSKPCWDRPQHKPRIKGRKR